MYVSNILGRLHNRPLFKQKRKKKKKKRMLAEQKQVLQENCGRFSKDPSPYKSG